MGKFINTKPTILVVDDEEDFLQIMEHTLQTEGFNVEIAPNAMHISEMIDRASPDIILLDIYMDGVDGSEICHEIKSNPQTAHVPVVMFSANDDIEKITKDCGANGFIKKPCNTQTVKEVLLQILGSYPDVQGTAAKKINY